MYDKRDLTATPFKFANPRKTTTPKRNFGSSVASNNRYLVIGCFDFDHNGVSKQGVALIYDVGKSKFAKDIPKNLVQVTFSGISILEPAALAAPHQKNCMKINEDTINSLPLLELTLLTDVS